MKFEYTTDVDQSWYNLTTLAKLATSRTWRINSYLGSNGRNRQIPTVTHGSGLERPSIWVSLEDGTGNTHKSGQLVVDAMTMLDSHETKRLVPVNAVGLRTPKQGWLKWLYQPLPGFSIAATHADYMTCMGDPGAPPIPATNTHIVPVDRADYGAWSHGRREAALTVVSYIEADVTGLVKSRSLSDRNEP